MPIYLYQCPNCEYQSEELVLPGEEKEKQCPNCQSIKMKRKPAKVSFKGSQSCSCSANTCQSCLEK